MLLHQFAQSLCFLPQCLLLYEIIEVLCKVQGWVGTEVVSTQCKASVSGAMRKWKAGAKEAVVKVWKLVLHCWGVCWRPLATWQQLAQKAWRATLLIVFTVPRGFSHGKFRVLRFGELTVTREMILLKVSSCAKAEARCRGSWGVSVEWVSCRSHAADRWGRGRTLKE